MRAEAMRGGAARIFLSAPRSALVSVPRSVLMSAVLPAVLASRPAALGRAGGAAA